MTRQISKNITVLGQADYILLNLVSAWENPDIQSSVTSKLRFQGG
ncbi:hypothetical protein METH109765_07835 [Mesobacillus thioparans]